MFKDCLEFAPSTRKYIVLVSFVLGWFFLHSHSKSVEGTIEHTCAEREFYNLMC